MAGGTWVAQDKKRPGAYINTKGVATEQPESSRGTVLLMDGVKHDWGKHGIIPLNAASKFKALLGSDLLDSQNKALRAVINSGASKVLYVNNNDGQKAIVKDDNLPFTFIAKYAGSKGNNIMVDVIKSLSGDTVTVKVIYDHVITSTQRITRADELMGDDYVDVSLTDNYADKFSKLSGEKTYQLAGGTSNYGNDTELLSEAISTNIFEVATTAGYPIDSNIHPLLSQMVEDLRNQEGYKVTAVVPGLVSTNYNAESTSVVINGYVLSDGTIVDTTSAAGYFAGASATVPYNQSLTYAEISGAVDTLPRMDNETITSAISNGKVVFSNRIDGSVVIEEDINSLTGFNNDKPQAFAKNRVIRTLDYIANDTKNVFEKSFIGKVTNNGTGQDLFKSNRVTALQNMQTEGMIEDFQPDDVQITAGDAKDSMVINLNIKPVDSMEKIYMTIAAN
ncbi:phage tail sheath subtilisin-like domain-containing protein (plasmid) [Apilactobacillus apisilvae]|uniref:Phage tail sheath subtilisin-like domain-containing protein n=1 Tax=Apilactobacillus apisilvae TaxID=2923364 RepID=A0ABY4PJ70_9LACO|nr:phage tail sheath C-terminal domain-containing protein [Apilactobacillus apisilvae]UQS85864.1 phage tail sheath subtilisin-like domain-containing protein [Apilactobacillus apisilvae]